MKSRALALVVTGVLMTLAACKPGTPSQYIQPSVMEDILVDYHLAEALAMQISPSQDERDYNQSLYLEAVLRKHGVTRAEFDSSLVYYYTRADRFDPIYQRVAERLEDRALVLGASEGEIGKYAQYNASGDTANIWADRTMIALMPQPPYNRWDFAIENDTLFRRGDALLMQFLSDFMYQNGTKEGVLYLTVDYQDTVVSRHLHFSSSGLTQLRVQDNKDRTIKAIRGYFYLGGGNDASTTVRLLFLNNVQLIRFHTLNETQIAELDSIARADSIATATDSLARDSLGRRLEGDSISRRDSTGRSEAPLPPDTGARPHRVAAGLRRPEAR